MKLNTAPSPDIRNHEGTACKRISPYQQLRRTVLACMLWEDSFYEEGVAIADRIKDLVKKVTSEELASLALEAREKMKLRHVPLLLVREMARHDSIHKRLVAKTLEKVIQRPDELSEFVAIYWKEKRQPLSAQVKKGLAAAFIKFSAYSLSKYNRDAAVKLRDVLFLCHAKPKDEEQAATWKKLVYGTLEAPDTWEVALSSGKDKKETWERLIVENKLGALAFLRNLRNMQQVNIDEKLIKDGLSNLNVERVLPFRFIAAAKYAPSLEPDIEACMFRCLKEIQKLPGKTALVVDTSPSMWGANVSEKSEMTRFEAAAALAILIREICEEVRIYAFNEKAYEVPPRQGFGLRDALEKTKGNASCGGLAVALANQQGYDRIIILTDGQWHMSNTGALSVMSLMGDAKVISPAPLTSKAYMINMETSQYGVGYGKWTNIDGWSEAIISYIAEYESSEVVE